MVVGMDNRVMATSQTMKSIAEIIGKATDIRMYDVKDCDPITNYVDMVNHKVDMMILLPGKFEDFCIDNNVPVLVVPEY